MCANKKEGDIIYSILEQKYRQGPCHRYCIQDEVSVFRKIGSHNQVATDYCMLLYQRIV